MVSTSFATLRDRVLRLPRVVEERRLVDGAVRRDLLPEGPAAQLAVMRAWRRRPAASWRRWAGRRVSDGSLERDLDMTELRFVPRRQARARSAALRRVALCARGGARARSRRRARAARGRGPQRRSRGPSSARARAPRATPARCSDARTRPSAATASFCEGWTRRARTPSATRGSNSTRSLTSGGARATPKSPWSQSASDEVGGQLEALAFARLEVGHGARSANARSRRGRRRARRRRWRRRAGRARRGAR